MPIVYNTEPENRGGFSPQSPPGVYTHELGGGSRFSHYFWEGHLNLVYSRFKHLCN